MWVSLLGCDHNEEVFVAKGKVIKVLPRIGGWNSRAEAIIIHCDDFDYRIYSEWFNLGDSVKVYLKHRYMDSDIYIAKKVGN